MQKQRKKSINNGGKPFNDRKELGKNPSIIGENPPMAENNWGKPINNWGKPINDRNLQSETNQVSPIVKKCKNNGKNPSIIGENPSMTENNWGKTHQ